MPQHTETSTPSTPSRVTEWDVVWPPEFRHPRAFDSRTENRPQVKYLDEVECGSTSGDEPEDSAGGLSEAEEDGGDVTTAESRGGDEQGSPVIGVECGSTSGDEPKDSADGLSEAEEDQKPESAVRRLGVVVSGESELSHRHRSEIDEIVEFIENRTAETSGAPSLHVALIIDQIEGLDETSEITEHQHRRADYRVITRDKLLAHLQIPRFSEPPGSSTPTAPDPVGRFNTEVIYMSDMDGPEMEHLASTVSISHTNSYFEFLHYSLRNDPFLGVSISLGGFSTFTMHIHLPLLALREHEAPYLDFRGKANGEPLRQAWNVPFIPPSSQNPNPSSRWYLHEVQRSMTLVGIDDQVWTAYVSVDTKYDGETSENSVAFHNAESHLTRERHDPVSKRILPTTYGKPKIDPSFLDARKYFLTVLGIWTPDLQKEYSFLLGRLEESINKGCPVKVRDNVRDFDKWNNDVLICLRKITSSLSKAIEAFELFKDDLGYFPPEFKRHFLGIKKRFRLLGQLKTRFEELEVSVKSEHREVGTQLGLNNYDAAVKVGALAVLAVISTPISQVLTMFSIQQGLPFPLSATSFLCSILVFGGLYALVYGLVTKWPHTITPLFTRSKHQILQALTHVHGKGQDAFEAITAALKWKQAAELEGLKPVAENRDSERLAAITGPLRSPPWSILGQILRNRRRDQAVESELSVAAAV